MSQPFFSNNMKLQYPHCDKNGFHQGEQVNLVCLEEKCIQESQNLLCSACFEESHKNHCCRPLKYLLSEMLKELSFQSESEKECLNLELILDYIEGNQQSVLTNIKNFANSFVQSMLAIEQKYAEYYENLKVHVIQHFNKGNKQDIIQGIMEQEQNLENLKLNTANLLQLSQNFIQNELASRKSENQNKNRNQQNSQSDPVDTITVQERIKSCTSQLDTKLNTFNSDLTKILQEQDNFILNCIQTSSLKWKTLFQNSNQNMFFNFIKNSNQSSNQIIEHEVGVEFESNSKAGSEGCITSSISFDSGQHGYSMEIKNFSTTCFLIGIYEEKSAENNTTTNGSHPWACLFNTCKGKMTSQKSGDHFGKYIKAGDVIKVQMDYEKNAYKIFDELGRLEYNMQPNQYNFTGKKLKFFMSFYNASCGVRLRIFDTY